MSKQRYIDTKFWDDSYVLTLDPSEKLVFLYLLTSPLTAICGVYEIALKRVAFDTGFDQDTVMRILSRFERDGRCIYRNGWIALRNWIKHQSDSPKIQRGIELQLAEVPPKLAEYVSGYPIDIISDPNPNPNINSNTNSNTNGKSSRKIAKDPIGTEAKECLDYYFQKHITPLPEGRGFRPTPAWERDMKIFKRLLGNYDVEAVKEILDMFFVESWVSNGKEFRRSNFSMPAFSKSFDTLYGVNKAKAEGRR